MQHSLQNQINYKNFQSICFSLWLTYPIGLRPLINPCIARSTSLFTVILSSWVAKLHLNFEKKKYKCLFKQVKRIEKTRTDFSQHQNLFENKKNKTRLKKYVFFQDVEYKLYLLVLPSHRNLKHITCLSLISCHGLFLLTLVKHFFKKKSRRETANIFVLSGFEFYVFWV
jgi:hypothetical protein